MVTLGPHTIRDTAGRVLSPSFALIALPFLLLMVNISWILTYPETVDGWVYFGFFENPRSYLHAFAGTYYSTRLS